MSIATVNRVYQPTVAGYFYPSDSETLREEVARLTPAAMERIVATGVIVPHGLYRYAGAIMGETFGRVQIPRRCIVLGSNHTGCGKTWSVLTHGAFQTPLGDVEIDGELAEALRRACPLVMEDEIAHKREHAIEVLLPFLQRLRPDGLTVMPLVINSRQPEEMAQVAEALACVVRACSEPVLLIASADLTQYEQRRITAEIDAQLLDAIRTLNAPLFLERVESLKVNLCGAGPIACVLEAARLLGSLEAQRVRYATSADAGGDPYSATGYAGIILR